MRSIRTRLLLFSTIIVGIAFAVTSGINISIVDLLVSEFRGVTLDNGKEISNDIGQIFEKNKGKITNLIEKQVKTKSNNLINESELIFTPAFTDGSFSFISQLLSQRVEMDDDIVYASFFSQVAGKLTLWTLSTDAEPSRLLFSALYEADSESWVRGKNRDIVIPDKGILELVENEEQSIKKVKYSVADESGKVREIEAYDVFTPVYSESAGMDGEEEQIGYLRYIISLESMRALLLAEDAAQAEQKKLNQDKLETLIGKVAILAKESFGRSVKLLGGTAVSILLLASILFYLLANKITVPLLKLKSSAATITQGNYNEPVEIIGRDEVGALAGSFEAMRQKVKEFTEHLQELVDQRTAELREALKQVTEEKQKIQEILTHIEQGIVMIDEEMKISSQYSEFVKTIFEVEPEDFVDKEIFDLVFKNVVSNQEDSIRSQEAIRMTVGDDRLAFVANETHFINEMTVNVNGQEKILTFNWMPIYDEDDFITKMICSFMDVTQKRALEKAIEEEKQITRNCAPSFVMHAQSSIRFLIRTMRSRSPLTQIVL